MLSRAEYAALVEAGPTVVIRGDAGTVPRAVALAEDSPFHTGEVWKGSFLCGPSLTHLELEIDQSQNNDVRATFTFRHAQSGQSGQYSMRGTYAPSGRKLRLEMGTWITRPAGAVAVELDGTVDARGERYEGRVLGGPGCSSFTVRRAPDAP